MATNVALAYLCSMTKSQAHKKAGILADQLKRHCSAAGMKCLLFVEQKEGIAKIGLCNDGFVSDVMVDLHLTCKEASANAHDRLMEMSKNAEKDVPAAVS
jgi:hypothetical protein